MAEPRSEERWPDLTLLRRTPTASDGARRRKRSKRRRRMRAGLATRPVTSREELPSDGHRLQAYRRSARKRKVMDLNVAPTPLHPARTSPQPMAASWIVREGDMEARGPLLTVPTTSIELSYVLKRGDVTGEMALVFTRPKPTRITERPVGGAHGNVVGMSALP